MVRRPTPDGTRIFFNGEFAQWDSWSPTFLGGQIYTYVDGYLMTNDLLTNAVLQTVSVQGPVQGDARQHERRARLGR